MNQEVGHVLRKYDPSEWGGTETCVVETTARLADKGFSNTIFAPNGDFASDEMIRNRNRLERYPAVVPFLTNEEHRRQLRALGGNLLPLDLPFRLAMGHSFDLLHTHTMGRVGGCVRTAARWRSVPYVVSIHGPLTAQSAWVSEHTQKQIRGAFDWGRPFGALLGARRVLDDAARVIVFNSEERAALQQRYGAKVVQMDHGVDLTRFAQGDFQRSVIHGVIPKTARLVLQVGRLSEQKQPLLALEAFAKGSSTEWHLAFAGAESEPGILHALKSMAATLGVSDRVHFLGNVAAKDVPHLMARAELCLLSSKQEAFGLAVLEAWAAHKPILFASHSGLAELARALGSDPSVVRSLRVDDWADAIRSMLQQESLRRQSAERGAQLVNERFNWETVTRRLAALYEEVLEEHRTMQRGTT